MIDPRPENAPPEVLEREAHKKALMMSSDAEPNEALPPDDDLSEEEKAIITALPALQLHGNPEIPRQLALPKDPLEAFAEILKDYGDHREVKIHTPIGILVLRALHVSVNQNGVALILSKNDMHLEPTFGSELKIEVDGREMIVIYGGGLFTFKKIPVTFISFFRVSEDQESPAAEEPI